MTSQQESSSFPWEWVYVIGWIAIPWAIRKYSEYQRERRLIQEKLKLRPKRVKTVWDRLVSLLLVGACIHAVYMMSSHIPRNLLEEWDVPLNAPSFVLRNKFRAHMAEMYEGWTEGATLGRGRWEPEAERDIKELEQLYDRLKSKSSRQLYLTCGHEAFLRCSWCKENVDFIIYALPSIIGTYFYFLVVVGLSTMTWKKETWRNPAAILLGIVLSVDLAITFAVDDVKREMMGKESDDDDSMAPFAKGFIVRYFMFAVLCLCMWLIDRRENVTEEDIVNDTAQALGQVFNRQQAVRMAKAASLGDTNLRRGYFEFYKEKEASKDAVERDIEFKTRRQKALRSYNAGKIIQEAQAFSEAMVGLAKADGIIKHVELPQDALSVDSLIKELGLEDEGTCL